MEKHWKMGESGKSGAELLGKCRIFKQTMNEDQPRIAALFSNLEPDKCGKREYLG